ncbi:MAG: hypothetical protein A2508_03875 [Candidatus Lambdaproteobacteria bacterium RIFOXYD12_FULL_49_8]|uniref:SAM-dependent MTase RsmB/NOP-type domain-containing protein n=1 Tax=Candidatus Lambdaproteobacteria bacterium RIFOXYD2_FULL_50_16 TaxID=1817772 RepID=A0A1F6GBG6_9PROT|nr:MAG: hypothetical protein A2527_07020 [Candidatus Lambdaproteobacteria bacterium RIFOXYD2_FULL_50_16]OGG97740.1 MAG: hypothetical protein A2508_03875 [Candidatus Lambdaproteobacteria bacterium RIFOXYD12_FULL_49_8]
MPSEEQPRYLGQLEWLTRLFANAEEAFKAGHPVDQALANEFRTHRKLGSKDRRFYTTVIYGYYRHRGWLVQLEEAKALFLAYALEGFAPSKLWADQLGLEAVEPAPQGLAEKLTWIRRFLPKALALELQPSFVEPMEKQVLESLLSRPRLWIRLLGPATEFFERLKKDGTQFEEHERQKGAFWLSRSMDLKPYADQVQIQDLSSQAVAPASGARPGETWLDLCAGAGGKGLHLWDQMQNEGRLTLADIRPEALAEAKSRAQAAGRTGISYCALNQGDPLPDHAYDGVIIDAPCSGSGTWHRSPWARWQLDQTHFNEILKTQAQLLRQGVFKLKPGGVLLYATCSLISSENSAQVWAFLAENRAFGLEPFLDPLSGEPTSGELTILPGRWGSNGMYLARLRHEG